MKEATGELSTTVITIVAIAAIVAVFTVFLLPTLKAQMALTQACNGGPGYTTNQNGYKVECTGIGDGKPEGDNVKLCNSGTDNAGQEFYCAYTETKTKTNN